MLTSWNPEQGQRPQESALLPKGWADGRAVRGNLRKSVKGGGKKLHEAVAIYAAAFLKITSTAKPGRLSDKVSCAVKVGDGRD